MGQIRNYQWRFARPVKPGEQMNRELLFWGQGEVEAPKAGEILVQTHYLATSPAQFGYLQPGQSVADPLSVGEVFRARGVGQVIESAHESYKVGDVVAASLGWQNYALLKPNEAGSFVGAVQKIENPVAPLSFFAGILGPDGYAAYLELTDLGKPQQGETLVVSAAAGGIGSVVGQIGKILGCRVIGIAGRADKCSWLVDELGFDGAINYKSENVEERLRELCPKGVDVFFDNVGGETLDAVLSQLALHARVIICGFISTQFDGGTSPGPKNYGQLLLKRATMTGRLVFDYIDRWPEADHQLRTWLKEGRLKNAEDIVEGLENAPEALAGLFTGDNKGNRIIKVAADPEGLPLL